MAQVHRAIAKHGAFQRPVALKRLLSHIADSGEMVKSFVREARLASYLRHENVAQTYELGRVGNIYFMVMELISGRNLREVLRHCGATTGPMPVPIALNILNQICDALDYAHNLCDETGQPLKIIHRDVSPSNVIVSDSGVVKLIDFGIAKASGRGMQTIGGTLKGKFAYMAPEYIAGRIDARADLFAVGVIAHELLTNRPLFSGRDDIDTLTRVRDMHIDPPSLKNPLVPPEIDDIVMTALARDPEGRWQHATALRTALTTLTRRLDLVATNAQVVQWLDWAFACAPAGRQRSETDTDPDAEPLPDEPSISIEPCTVDLSGTSQKLALIMRDEPPAPPLKTPAGTPAYVPAQRPSAPRLISDPVASNARDGRITAPAPRATASSAVPAMSGLSAPYVAGARATSSIPAAALPEVVPPAPVVHGFQAPPTLAAHGSPPPPAPAFHNFQAPPAPAFHAFYSPPVPAFHGAPAPAAQAAPIPGGAPFACPYPVVPRSYESAHSEVASRWIDRPAPAPAPGASPSARRRRLPAVVLVVCAAAIAAITVYFVLPLLT